MTNDQLARLAAERMFALCAEKHHDTVSLKTATKAIADTYAEAMQGWIPCSELLPGLGMCVLLARGKESVSGKVVGCTNQYNVRLDQGDRILVVSTKAYRHWQPLPQPPEATK